MGTGMGEVSCRRLISGHSICPRIIGMRTVRVLIVDDDRASRRGLKISLRAEPGIEVVGEAANGLQAIELAGVLRPEIVIMDVRMPVMDGLTAGQRIATLHPEIAIIILTMHDDRVARETALQFGALGVIGKQLVDDELLPALRRVMASQGPAKMTED